METAFLVLVIVAPLLALTWALLQAEEIVDGSE